MNILDQLEDLERKATPGPWRAIDNKDRFGNPRDVGWIDSDGDMVVDYAGCGSHEAKWGCGCLDLTVAMRNALPALLRVARAACAEPDVGAELRDALAELTKEVV